MNVIQVIGIVALAIGSFNFGMKVGRDIGIDVSAKAMREAVFQNCDETGRLNYYIEDHDAVVICEVQRDYAKRKKELFDDDGKPKLVAPMSAPTDRAETFTQASAWR